VLVVDDNPTNREILLRQLSGWGVRAEGVASGTRALQVLRAPLDRVPFDLVLLDMMMPDMDGLEVARSIRADGALADVPLVLLTSAGAMPEGPAASVVDLVLTKPVRARELQDALARERRGAGPAPAPRGREASPAGARVLLVEDNVVNQEVALAFLEGLGCRTTVAADGREAATVFAANAFDLILMDCMMPDMDGFETTRAIREHEAAAGTPRVPIVALTASVLAGERERCLEAGMDDYLTKPLGQERLEAMLARWIRRAGPPPAEAPMVAPRPEAVLDPAALDALRRYPRGPGGAALLARAGEAYLRDAPTKIQALRASLAIMDRAGVRRLAHTLKSSSAMFGAATLAELCQGLETGAPALTAADGEQRLAAVEREYARVEQALQHVLDTERSHG
jgi:CheY-like chemotaxis protein/HPt (histidine-containing phosphotransfer) domain-containing protein